MVSRKKTFRRRSKSQKLYKMKGCNKSKKNIFFGGESNAAAYPSSGPPAGGFNFLNPQSTQRGGCGCGLQVGGSKRKGGCGPACTSMLGGKYRRGRKHNKTIKGGSGNNGISYPNGLVGSAWRPNISGWPGVDGISGNRNYIEQNQYLNDPQTAMIATGAQPPFSIGGRRRKQRQRGGSLSNFLGQDFINLGRQFQHGLGIAYNGISGYPAPNSPLPWKGQLANTSNLSTVKASFL